PQRHPPPHPALLQKPSEKPPSEAAKMNGRISPIRPSPTSVSSGNITAAASSHLLLTRRRLQRCDGQSDPPKEGHGRAPVGECRLEQVESNESSEPEPVRRDPVREGKRTKN